MLLYINMAIIFDFKFGYIFSIFNGYIFGINFCRKVIVAIFLELYWL